MCKLLFVTNDAWFFVSHRLELASTMHESGWSCFVSARPDETVDQIEKAGAKFLPWSVRPRGKSFLTEISTFLELRKVLKEVKPDLVHMITIKPVLYGGILCRLMGVPSCVFAVSGLGALFSGTSLFSRMLRFPLILIYRFVVNHPNNILIFQNEDNKKQLLTLLGIDANTRLIRGSGVNLSNFALIEEPSGIPVVTLAARLLKDKGIGEFVDAAAILMERGLEVKCQVAGGNSGAGNPAAYTQNELETLQQKTHIDWLGEVKNIPDLFSKSNIVVLPSYHEGLPKVLVEAGAAGRPVVTTNIPGCKDAITPGETGLLVPVRDPIALANAIETLLLDKSLRQKMGGAGRELVEREMQTTSISAQHKTIYEDLNSMSSKL